LRAAPAGFPRKWLVKERKWRKKLFLPGLLYLRKSIELHTDKGESMQEQWLSYMDMFCRTAADNAGRTALIHGERRVRYGELDKAGDVIAAALSALPVARGQIVPIVLPRGIDALAAMLGIWKAGAVASFLNTAYPAERIAELCRQCGGGFSVSEDWIKELDPFAKIAPLNVQGEKPEREDPAMVVFTSGSTGEPKGVVLPHRAIAHRTFINRRDVFLHDGGFDPKTDIWLSIVPFSAVVMVAHELTILLMGGTIDIAPDAVKQDIPQLIQYARDHKCTSGFVPPALAPLFLKYFEGQFTILAIGSERVSNLYSDKMVVINGYGASEGAGTNCTFTLDRIYENTPIGKPPAGTNVYLLDSEGRQVPDGEIGELCISGETVALGYLNRPDLTAEKFIPNPFCDDPLHRVIYRTGDLGRLLADGNYEYLQRADWMIKIRGNRVEPGEIERAISQVAPVSKAVVVGFESRLGETSGTRLYACYTAQEPVDPQKVREGLAKILPDYMVPSFIEQVASLPLNANGKVDRKKIVPPEIEFFKSDYEPPANDLEKTICNAFEEVLELGQVGALDNFILLGGDSVSAAKAALLLYKSTRLSVVDVLLSQTPRDLAAIAASKLQEGPDYSFDLPAEFLETPVPSKVELTPYQATFYYEWLLNPDRYDYNIVEDRILEGKVSPERLNYGIIRLLNDYFLFNCNVAEDNDRLFWKQREPVPNEAEIVRYFDQPLADEELFSLIVKPFDLENDLLVRYFLIKLSDTRYRYISCVHHIIIDGTKANAAYAEYARYYNDPHYRGLLDTEKQKILCNELTLRLRSLIEKNREAIHRFWRDYCRDVSPVDLKFLSLRAGPGDNAPLSPVSSYRFSLGQKELQRVKIISQKFGITPYIYAEIVFAALLHKMSGQSRISFSYPATISEGSGLMFGSQINTLIINFAFDSETDIAGLFQQARDFFKDVELCGAKYLPINEIAGYLENKEALQIAFAQTNLRETEIMFDGVARETINDSFYFDNNNTFLAQLEERDNQFNFKFKYKNRILDRNLVENFSKMYQRLFVDMLNELLSDDSGISR
jgi:amino acid adenylation domain-containing protein